jgi:ankyrin repeat protein
MGNRQAVGAARPVDPDAIQRLNAAALIGNLPAVTQLIETGLDVNCVLVNEEGRRLGTPLTQAIRGKHIDVVIYLMANGASLSVENGTDDHLLHYAAKCGFVEAIEYFIRWRDVNPSRPASLQQTALHFACRGGHLNVIKYMVHTHGGINARAQTRYETPLHIAAYVGPAAVVRYLIDHGADVRASSEDGLQAIHFVADWEMHNGHHKSEDDRVASLKLLLRHGSNPLAECQGGLLPLHMASTARIAKALVEHEYWKSLASEPFDPMAAFTMLCKKNGCDETPLDVAKRLCNANPEQDAASHQSLRNRRVLVAYLEGWLSSRLFVPMTNERSSFDLSVMVNPRLNLFQSFLANCLNDLLHETALAEVSDVILGYLSPHDVANRWDMWLKYS